MVNYVFVAAGQCGNQLSFDLLSALQLHAQSQHRSTQYQSAYPKGVEPGSNSRDDDSSELLLESLFRSSATKDALPTARTVCLDTEPKVIENCLARSQAKTATWRYEPKSLLFRHGGAGNNWALGYAMASGEFLEKSLDSIRRELEHCDHQSGLVFLHSLAGGTGSGLGTHITESCEDAFSSSFRSNIVIAPHHFGEVVVQHYNALLCLSKIHDSSDGIVLFENEIAQLLCKEMQGIDKPLLKDLNSVIVSNLLTMFLPTHSLRSGNACDARRSHLFDKMTFLCSHPGYRFANIRLTPQTSKKSIDFTYDSWTALLRSVQRMQLSGTLLERRVRPEINSILRRREQTIDDGRPTPGPIPAQDRAQFNKSLASVVACHGDGAAPAAQRLANPTTETLDKRITPVKDRQSMLEGSVAFTTRTRGTSTTVAADQNLSLLDEYTDSHSPIAGESIQFESSSFLVNRYQRSVTSISNDQSIVPILNRSLLKCQDMFTVDAYVHQYTSNGLERTDFLDAFRSVGSIVHNYNGL